MYAIHSLAVNPWVYMRWAPIKQPVLPNPALQCTAIFPPLLIIHSAAPINFWTYSKVGQVPSSKIISMCLIFLFVNSFASYKWEFNLTTSWTLFSTKYSKTFWNGSFNPPRLLCWGDANAMKSLDITLKSPWSTLSYCSYSSKSNLAKSIIPLSLALHMAYTTSWIVIS